jgi:hypothetical protein
MKRLRAREKFWWRGFEFNQSICNSREVHWEMRHGTKQTSLRVRVIYRNVSDVDDETPPEYTVLIHVHGLAEGEGSHTGGSGVDPNLELALAHAESDFRRKLAMALRLSNELRRGKQPDPED